MSKIQVPVQICHIDAFGHVNNARFLEFFEAGKWQFFGESGYRETLLKEGMAFVVTNSNIDYIRPVKLGDELTIITQFDSVEDGRMVVLKVEAVNSSGKTCVRGKMTHLFVNKYGEPLTVTTGSLLYNVITFEHNDISNCIANS